MKPASLLSTARHRAALTQAEMAVRAGTSQATVSAYESGRKQPSAATLSRLLAAAGWRLSLAPAARPVVQPSAEMLAEAGQVFEQALDLAEALPSQHSAELRFPRLAPARRR